MLCTFMVTNTFQHSSSVHFCFLFALLCMAASIRCYFYCCDREGHHIDKAHVRGCYRMVKDLIENYNYRSQPARSEWAAIRRGLINLSRDYFYSNGYRQYKYVGHPLPKVIVALINRQFPYYVYCMRKQRAKSKEQFHLILFLLFVLCV